MSVVYLLHFHRKIGSQHPKGGAQHYIGFAEDLDARLQQHAKGQGSAIMNFLHQAGIGWRIARLWLDGSRDLERALKNRKNARALCPVCQSHSR